MSTPEALDKLLTECCEHLVECSSIVRDIPLEPSKANIYKIGKALAEIFELRNELYKIHPHLKPENWDQAITEEDYSEMFENAIAWVNEYLEAGKPEKGVEVLERFISMGLNESTKAKVEKRIQELKDEFAL